MRYPSSLANDGRVHRKLIFLAVLIAMAVLPAASHAQGTDGGAITTGDPEADALIADIERVTAEMVEAREQFRSDRLDPDALLDVIGRDPDDIVEWVASETRWLPYEGALRGASGVLMDRSGSSLDRALLLADLLERSGLEVRLANATLPEATASALASAALDRPREPDEGLRFASEEEIAEYRASVGSAAQELADEVGLLAGPVAEGREPGDVIADHWWVQASSQGQWDDYDPLFAGGAEARPPAATTLDPADLPDELRHSVTLRVVIERYEDGALTEEVPLQHTLPMGAGRPNTPIELDFVAWVPPELRDRANKTTEVIEGARMSSAWRPWLTVDGQTVAGDWFSEAGRIESPEALVQESKLSEGLEGLKGLGSEPAEETTADARLSASWIEYETSGPGIEPRTERREILDLVGESRDGVGGIDALSLGSDDADVRRGLAFLGGSVALLQAAATHPDAILDALMENWIELRPALIAVAFQRAGVEDERIGPSLAAPQTRPIGLLAMTSARDRWSTSPAGYVGRPQVWSQHFFYDPQHEGSAASMAVDIVMNDTDVIPDTVPDPRLVRLEQGILDTLVEHVLSATPEGLNTWDRYARRRTENVTWSVLRPGTEPEPGLAEALPPADLARMRAALADGDSVVVAPAPRLNSAVPFAEWWRISDDGTALGMGYRGWGQELEEEVATTEPSLQTLTARKEAARVEAKLEEYRRAYETWIKRGGDPYAHLRDHPALVNPLEETQPIIEALADTLPFIYAM